MRVWNKVLQEIQVVRATERPLRPQRGVMLGTFGAVLPVPAGAIIGCGLRSVV